MLTRYDPDRAPDPQRWLATDEMDRIELVRRYHRRAGIRMPREMAHAALHVAVENQVAMGDELPVAATLRRLMDEEGVDRHEALHAVASVLVRHMGRLQSGEIPAGEDPNVSYFADLETLTIRCWREEFG